MNEITTKLIVGLVGILISALGTYVTYLINRFVKNNELKTIIISLDDLVKKSVLEVYQTYVEELKDKNIFNENDQKIALERCLDLIKTNMSYEVKEWLETNFKDIERYLKSLIEAQIGLLKNGGSK